MRLSTRSRGDNGIFVEVALPVAWWSSRSKQSLHDVPFYPADAV